MLTGIELMNELVDELNELKLSTMAATCILRSPADSDAFQSGRYAEHNGRSKTFDFIV